MKKNLKRREFLKKAGVAGAAAVGASTLAAPAIAGGHQEWIICSAFGKAGVLGQAIQAFGDNINSYSEKLKVKVYHAGELVPGLEAILTKYGLAKPTATPSRFPYPGAKA